MVSKVPGNNGGRKGPTTTGMDLHKDAKGMNTRQRAFVRAYLNNGFNATRAAMEAGYAEASAAVRGCELIRKSNVREQIDAYLSDMGVSRDRILAEKADIAFNTDMADMQPVLEGVSLEKAREMGVNTKRIKKIKITRRVRGQGEDAYEVEDVALELYDSQAELDRLAKAVGVYNEHEAASAPTFNIDARTVALLAAPATESEKAVREMLMLEYAGPLNEEGE